MEERHRISWFSAGMLLGVAVCLDLAQLFVAGIGLIPLIGWVFAPLLNVLLLAFGFGVLCMIWLFVFQFSVQELTRLRRVAGTAATAVFEMLPFVSALPLWTIHTSIMILLVRREDKKYNAEIRKQREADAAGRRNAQIAMALAAAQARPGSAAVNDSWQQTYEQPLAA